MAGPGEKIGEYTLVTRLGSGGMGTVWESRNPRGESVALKVLHPGISADPDARARLQREVSTLERLRGARVAQVLDARIAPDVSYIVTTLVEGLSLEESVAQEGAFDPLDLHPLAQGLYEAVSQVHRAGLLHRDIKPGNVMVTYDGPVLIDFGIAQALDDARLTHTGFVTGTPGYIDPATLHGGGLASEGDWYGLAAVLLFAATGRAPFGRGRMEIVLGRMATGSPDVEGLPAGVGAAFQAALAPDPAQRPPHAQLLTTLQRWAQGRDVSDATLAVPPPPPPGRGGQPATTVVPPRPAPAAPGPPAPSSQPPAPSYAPRPPDRGAQGAQVAPDVAPPSPAPTSQPARLGPDGEPIPAWAIAPRARPGLVLAWAGAGCAFAFGWPGYAVVVVALGFVLFTLAGMLTRRTRNRRYAAGPRRSDGWVSAGWALPLLLPAAVTSLVPLLLGALASTVTWWIMTRLVLTDYAGALPANLSGAVVPMALAVGMAVAWWVPLSQVTRLGARSMWSLLAPERTFTWIWLGVAVVLGLVLLVLAPTEPIWTPFPAPPPA